MQARALGRCVFLNEVFQQTHIWKGIGEYVDERSRKTNVSLFYCSILFTLKLIYVSHHIIIIVNCLLTRRILDLPIPSKIWGFLMCWYNKSNPLLILHRMRILWLGVGLRQLEEKRKENLMEMVNLFQNIRVQMKAWTNYQLLPFLILRTSIILGSNFHATWRKMSNWGLSFDPFNH